jgi:hypothetical protein
MSIPIHQRISPEPATPHQIWSHGLPASVLPRPAPSICVDSASGGNLTLAS